MILKVMFTLIQESKKPKLKSLEMNYTLNKRFSISKSFKVN